MKFFQWNCLEHLLCILVCSWAVAAEDCHDDCKEDEFRCENGLCIPEDWLCDGDYDCPYRGEDEQIHGCCYSGVMCRTQWSAEKVCISIYGLCDGYRECIDGEDEDHDFCPEKCDDCEFACSTGQCFPDYVKCDGYPHCPAGDDEEDCDKPCTDKEFECDNGKCISILSVCDGIDDCCEGEDESGCPACCEGEISCNTSSVCIREDQKCDERVDCPGQADEHGCGTLTKQPYREPTPEVPPPGPDAHVFGANLHPQKMYSGKFYHN